jgi:Ca2+-binding RTX toxin-like protein
VLRGALTTALAAAFVLTGVSTASASTGGVSGGVLTYTATSGENNDVQIWPTSATPGAISLDDFGTASLVANAGCALVTGELHCTGVTSIVLNLGNSADYADWTAVSVPVTYNAGSGADEGYGGGGSDTFAMSTGDDYVEAGSGNDTITLDSGYDYGLAEAGNDTFTGVDDFSDDYMYGGSGNDSVDYSDRTERVNVSLDGVANDGEVGENDLVEADIENVVGGSGNDDLTGNDLGANTLTGGAGNDALVGNGGGDTLSGDDGEDALTGGAGADVLDGGADGDVHQRP